MIVDCGLYERGRRTVDGLPLPEVVARGRHDPEAFVWIGLAEPTDEEFAEVRDTFGLHPLAVEDAIHAHQRPKLERYGDSLFVVMKTAAHGDGGLEIGELMVFVGDGFVVTVRHGRAAPLSEVRRDLEGRPDLLAHGVGAVLHAVLDRVVDGYVAVLDRLDLAVDDIETTVFAPGRHDVIEAIYHAKREVQAFRRAVTPLGEVTVGLADSPPLHVSDGLAEYLRDVHDHVVRSADRVANLDELLNNALDAHLAQISLRQNEDMRRISAWVGIVAVPTMIGGIYGMNFEHMPELEWRYGYPVVLAVMGTISLVLHRIFKRTGWL